MNYIDDTIKIDFPVPKIVKFMMDECEKYDREDDYGLYEPYASHLTSVICKNLCADGILTTKQWHMIERRYLL